MVYMLISCHDICVRTDIANVLSLNVTRLRIVLCHSSSSASVSMC